MEYISWSGIIQNIVDKFKNVKNYLIAMKQLIPIGVLVIFVGMMLIFIGALSSIKDGKSDSKIAVGGFIGFIPFGFANDKRMLYFVIGVSAIFMIIWFIFQR